MAIDVTRVKRTRGGHEVRIYATDGSGTYPIHGAVKEDNGWKMCGWDNDGAVPWTLKGHPNELVEEPRTVEFDRWLNVYRDGTFHLHHDRITADHCAKHDRIACVNIKRTVTEGEGL